MLVHLLVTIDSSDRQMALHTVAAQLLTVCSKFLPISADLQGRTRTVSMLSSIRSIYATLFLSLIPEAT